ncbi:MAG: carbamoyltransferase C-terminal domain-containing protein [Candidatus Omnitrophota bacterium]|nr:carbamoyltransferase C-terminal domain-containing protein [Candidatus Omnitrophota bacterium]
MKVLGLCDNHDSGAALISNGKIKSAISEERLDRVKLSRNFPFLSINKVFEMGKISMDDVDKIVVASKFTPNFVLRLFSCKYSKMKKSQFDYSLNLYFIYQSLLKKIGLEKVDETLSKIVLQRKLKFKNISLVDHHLAHAAAYYTSGLNKALIITIDSMGDGVTLTVNIGQGNSINRVYSQSGFSAISLYYSRITEALGFTAIKHEGKVVGLASYGNPTPLLSCMKKMLHFKGPGFNLQNHFLKQGKKSGIFKEIKKHASKDVAAAAQLNLEQEVCKFVDFWVKKTGIKNLVVSGGLFANVKLNQRIHELESVKSVYVFPHMGDGGLAFGAVMHELKPKPFRFKNLYFGPAYTNKEVKKELENNNIKHTFYKDIEKEVAKLLARGKVVARFKGAMEFGPRALGNRSILYQPNDASVNDWLNKNLRRTEFMPFAPTVLEEYAEKCFKNIKGAEYSAKFMTITFDCTDWMKKNCPGVVHVDGTARPQIVSKKDNASYYKLIDEYRKLTGIPCIINTSYNMHEEPIVCTPSDAIKAFKESKLNFLAIESFLAEQE